MGKLVVLKIGDGSFEQGFSITLQIGADGERPEIEIAGKLPIAPEIPIFYREWQKIYRHLGSRTRLEALAGVTNVSITDDCYRAARALTDSLNLWLNAEGFRPLRETLLSKLMPSEEIRLLLQTDNNQLQRLPWHLWDLFERYPFLEMALSAPAYESVAESSRSQTKVKILAILGNSAGINTERDRALLEELPFAEISFLLEPQRQEFNDKLWEQNWDILFFAGHSSSQADGETGRIHINRENTLTIEQLKYALKKAVAQGLKIAIFNSCDGLGLARELAQLQIPEIVVMREPVPDRVAQEFLKYFLAAFAGGKSFYLSVREARERLQGLEEQFPCATWLPIIYQNPAKVPPTWEEWCDGRKKEHFRRQHWRSRLQTILGSSIALTLSLLGVRWMGMLQPLELWAFDRLIRLRPTELPDSRLSIVAITEADIQAQSQEQRTGSLSDATLARLLAKLAQYQPRAIGLDVYRDFPVNANNSELAERLRSSENLIAVCKGRDWENDPDGVPPPPEISASRLGFSDFLEDADGVLRRHLLFMDPDPASPCTTPYAFSVQLAFRYLDREGISPKFTEEGNLQLGNTIFPSISLRTGGYQRIDYKGSQLLLNYRYSPSLERVAAQVTLSQVLNGRVNPEAFRDRIVLIGVTAVSAGDYWSTPYGVEPAKKIPGLFIQAQMVSQILSAVLDGRSLLWVWSEGGECIWIWIWSVAGGILAWRFPSPSKLVLAIAVAILGLSGVCFVFLIEGGWIPLIPPILVLVGTGGIVNYLNSQSHPNS